MQDARIIPDFGNQFVRDLVRITIKQTEPGNRRFLCQSAQKCGQHQLPVQISTVKRCVLCNQVQLANAFLFQHFCFFNNTFHRPGTIPATDGRNDAVGATVVTAFGNPQISGMRSCCQNPFPVQTAGVRAVKHGALFPVKRLFKDVRNGVNTPDAQKRVRFRHVLKDFFPVTLGETAGHDQLFQPSRFFQCPHFMNCIDGFPLCVRNKAACINNDRIRLGRITDNFKSRFVQMGKHHFGINLVFGTSQRDESDFDRGLFPGHFFVSVRC